MSLQQRNNLRAKYWNLSYRVGLWQGPRQDADAEEAVQLGRVLRRGRRPRVAVFREVRYRCGRGRHFCGGGTAIVRHSRMYGESLIIISTHPRPHLLFYDADLVDKL